MFNISALRAAIVATALAGVAACSADTGLAPGLTQSMDQPGARLDQAAALNILNHYRADQSVSALTAAAELDAQANTLARQYAASGKPPRNVPSGATFLTSAGYTRFADVFSGWRNSNPDARILADPSHRQLGLGVVSDPNSDYGVYWVLLLR